MELSPKPEHVSQTKLLKTFAFCTPLLTLLCMLRPVAEGLKNLFNYIAVWMAEIWQNSWGLVFASQNYGCRYMEFSVYMNIYIYISYIYIYTKYHVCFIYIYIYVYFTDLKIACFRKFPVKTPFWGHSTWSLRHDFMRYVTTPPKFKIDKPK